MKISDHGTPIKFEAVAIKIGDAGAHPAGPVHDSTDSNNSDRVVLFPRAREHQQARNLLKTIPDIDCAKVDKVRALMMQNAYRVDAYRVAEHMLNAMLSNASLLY